jgi:hypothetical protein
MCTVTLPRFWLSSEVNKGDYNLNHIEMFKNFSYKKKNENPHEDIREFQAESYLKKELKVDVKNTYEETKVIFQNEQDFLLFIFKYSSNNI